MNMIDLFAQNYFSTIRTPFLTNLMLFFTGIFDVTSLTSLIRFGVIIICVAALIYWIKNKKYVILFLSALLAGAVTSEALKLFFHVARPMGAIINESGQSFPSYHATVATVFFIMLMYIFDDYFGSFQRIAFNSICIIGIILVSVSRLYLGVHWLSDVVGGAVLGIIVSYISVRLFKYLLQV